MLLHIKGPDANHVAFLKWLKVILVTMTESCLLLCADRSLVGQSMQCVLNQLLDLPLIYHK